MQNKVIFNDGQDVDPADFNNLQTYAQDTFDTLVLDAVSASQRYAGLTVTKNGPTSVGIAAGRLYSGGKGYAFKTPLSQDFLTQLPVAGQKIVTVVAYGTESDTDVTPREFLINETTGQSQPKPVATRRARICNVQFAYGTEAPSPTPPLLDPGYTAVADILLTTTGVSTITMRTDNQVGNLDDVDDRLDELEDFEAAVGPKVTTLASDLAALARQLSASASNGVLGQLLMRVAAIEAKEGIPQDSVDSHADYFLDARNVDLTNPLSKCKIQEGIRFPDANAGVASLGLLNPLDVGAKQINGLLLPAYTRKLWLSTGQASDQIRLSSYTYQTNSLVQKSMSRQVVRYGAAFDVCTNSTFWQSGTYDPLTGIFTRAADGSTFKASLDLNGLPTAYTADGFLHVSVRLQQYWTDTVTTTYWDNVTTDHAVNGSFIAESFLQGQDIWLDAVGLYFTQLADTGDATVAVCEVSSSTGLPDVTAVISLTNLSRADMKVAPAETVVPLTPTFLAAGKRYAVCVITAADHWVATVPGEQFTAGTLFYILDGAYAQGDGTRDLQMNLYRAVPNQSRTSIQLNPLQLDGGILGIKINADAVVPKQCQLSYEIQVAGNWYALADVDEYVLGSGGAVLPLLPFRVTMIGSADMMPAVRLTDSEVQLTRPDVELTAVSKPFTLPGAGSQQIHVVQRYENWNGTLHTAAIQLLTGGTPVGGSTTYTTAVAPTSFTDVSGTDPIAGKWIERTYVFALGAGVTSFCIRTDVTTQSNRAQTHVAFQKDYEL